MGKCKVSLFQGFLLVFFLTGLVPSSAWAALSNYCQPDLDHDSVGSGTVYSIGSLSSCNNVNDIIVGTCFYSSLPNSCSGASYAQFDNCPGIANSNQADADGDKVGDACDPAPNFADRDLDEVGDSVDNCPTNANADQSDIDVDGLGDVCDPDSDGDGVQNAGDNCPLIANADQLDSDDDGVGNLCDSQPYSLSPSVAAVAAGGSHTCALLAAGGVKCWGLNYYGALGDGTQIQRTVAVDVNGLTSGASELVTGFYHSCAVIANGVKCWGVNDYGEIGDGTNTNRLSPVSVSGLGSGIAGIAAGFYHTCVQLSGNVMCWGWNRDGQLGDGSTTNRLTPVAVSGLSSPISKLTAGAWHTCALTATGGVKCWGNNQYGQLGNGTTVTSATPVDVTGLSSGVSAIAAGSFHTCAVLDSGGVTCWGQNTNGQLGDGSTTSTTLPVSVNNLAGIASSLAAGEKHTCALLLNGAVQCWGGNSYGQLGNGSTVSSVLPVTVNSLSSAVTSISSRQYHTCVRTAGGGAQCWGYNTSGQLGDGSKDNQLVPVYVRRLSGDPDNDGVASVFDNCLMDSNVSQINTDGDIQGNACDLDDDNDGLLDVMDPLPLQTRFNRDANYKGSLIRDSQAF